MDTYLVAGQIRTYKPRWNYEYPVSNLGVFQRQQSQIESALWLITERLAGRSNYGSYELTGIAAQLHFQRFYP